MSNVFTYTVVSTNTATGHMLVEFTNPVTDSKQLLNIPIPHDKGELSAHVAQYVPQSLWGAAIDLAEVAVGHHGAGNKPNTINPEVGQSQRYLDTTDWYVTRLAEIGTPIPAEVTRLRAMARSALNTKTIPVAVL